jgi:hypothetical protein
MCKPKIQPLIPLITRCGQILQSLLCTHCTPNPLSICISFYIIQLSPQIQKYVKHQDGKQDVVSALVARRVVCLVDVCGDYAGGLHAHVVEGSGDGS